MTWMWEWASMYTSKVCTKSKNVKAGILIHGACVSVLTCQSYQYGHGLMTDASIRPMPQSTLA